MAKKKDNTTIKENTVAQDKKRATRKKKDTTATVVNTQPTEKVKASPIKKTINTERPKTFKEIVSMTDFEDKKEQEIVAKPVYDNVDTTKMEQTKTEQQVDVPTHTCPVQDVPTHIGGVKLSERLVNLLRRKASNK